MKKRILSILLAVFMIMALAACGGSPSSTPASSSAPGSTGGDVSVATGDNIKVDVFWYTFSDTYLTSVRNAMEEQLGSMANITYTMHDCEEDQSIQTEKIQTALTQGTDLLIVNIVTTGSEETAQGIVDMAAEYDLPIIFFNREVSDDVINSYENAAFVGTDADEAGYMQGQAVAEFLLNEANWDGDTSIYDLDGDGEIKYIMFRGEHGNAEAFGRTKYSVEEANRLLADSGLTLVPSPANETSTQYEDDGVSNYFLYGNWSTATAADLMSTALTSYTLDGGQIELILANNDDQALGAIEAMNEEGYNTGESDQVGYIPVFGVDATTVAREAISGGKMTGTVLQDGPAMAECILALANNIANGEELFANTSGYNVDEGVDKIRIAYAIVT